MFFFAHHQIIANTGTNEVLFLVRHAVLLDLRSVHGGLRCWLGCPIPSPCFGERMDERQAVHRHANETPVTTDWQCWRSRCVVPNGLGGSSLGPWVKAGRVLYA